MSTQHITSGASGALFGAALAASRVYEPSVIIEQMRLADFHMLQVFIAASGSSALIFAVLDALNVSKVEPRSSASLGWLGRFDGNMLGGSMIGTGMALSGACPGTVLVQVAVGIRSGYLVLLGGLLGGALYSRFGAQLRRRSGVCEQEQQKSPRPSQQPTPPPTHSHAKTIHDHFNFSVRHAVLVYEVLCLGVLTLATVLNSSRRSLQSGVYPLAGGALIGASQMASLLLTGSALGVSTAYEVVGSWLWRISTASFSSAGAMEAKVSRPPSRPVFFAVGVALGGGLLHRSGLLGLTSQQNSTLYISDAQAVLGGLLLIVGARIAGGCTSGHGISGMSSLSISSIITVACMFTAGISMISFLA